MGKNLTSETARDLVQNLIPELYVHIAADTRSDAEFVLYRDLLEQKLFTVWTLPFLSPHQTLANRKSSDNLCYKSGYHMRLIDVKISVVLR